MWLLLPQNKRDFPFAGTISDPKIDQCEESAGNDHKRRDNRIVITVSSNQPVVRVLPNKKHLQFRVDYTNHVWFFTELDVYTPNKSQ